jgi:hypothetical protein
MTTPDIAGLCERLKTLWLELSDAHAEPPATARIMNALHQSGDTLERQAAEIARLREALTACVNAVAYTEGHDGRRSYSLRLTFGVAFQKAKAALTGEDT